MDTCHAKSQPGPLYVVPGILLESIKFDQLSPLCRRNFCTCLLKYMLKKVFFGGYGLMLSVVVIRSPPRILSYSTEVSMRRREFAHTPDESLRIVQ